VGFYPQPNDFSCGPFALKHALVALGRLASEDEISSVARPHWWSGTDELRLARAARAFDCDLTQLRRRDPERARRALIEFLRRPVPVILCVDDWGHWITVVRYEGARFVVVDSLLDPVLNVLSWPQLRRRWNYYDTDYDAEDPPVVFDLMPVEPRFRVTIKADFSVSRVQFLRRPENHDLALHWDEYLADLLEICRPRSTRLLGALSMAEFLRRNQELIQSRVVYWHGGVEKDEVARLLRNFRFVAETYGLVIPAAAARRALTDMAILVSLWTAAARGIDEMYGSAAPRRRR
jgi:hypothetical protein